MGRPRTRTDAGTPAPTAEVGYGYAGTQSYGLTTGKPLPWSAFADEGEYVPELMWPNSIGVFNQMRTDTQLAGLYTAVAYGITQLRFTIDPNGSRPEIVQGISQDLNLPIQGEDRAPKRRMKRRFAHGKHVAQVMLALMYGHMYFEQVGVIEEGLWRLRKLAPRMPDTLSEINVAPDGGLVSIRQKSDGRVYSPLLGSATYWLNGPVIPVTRLAGFVWQQEGPNWVGRSLFRDCYKPWLIKDRLIRVDANNHERAGGVPIGLASEFMTQGQIDELNLMMQQFRTGPEAGGALPAGADMKVIKGTGSAVADSIRMHDEAMARRFLLQLSNLAQGGQHVGSYALGEVFQDFFLLGQRAIAQWYCDVMNEHVIEDWVDWNYGEDEELAPLITWERTSEDALGVEQLRALVDSKIVLVDDELEDSVRYKYRLPRRTEPREELLAAEAPVPALGPGGESGAGDAPSLPAPAPSEEAPEE